MTKHRRHGTLKAAIYRTVTGLGGVEVVADYLDCSPKWVSIMSSPDATENVNMDWVDRLNNLWLDHKGEELSPLALHFGRNRKYSVETTDIKLNALTMTSGFGGYTGWVLDASEDGNISRNEARQGAEILGRVEDTVSAQKRLLNDIAEGRND